MDENAWSIGEPNASPEHAVDKAINRWWTEHQRNGINNKLHYHIYLHNKPTGTFSWIKRLPTLVPKSCEILD
ncbi:hypothetical protein Y032_0016g3117 [Ancylostoma ceylanicum]|nr:hypothetical protein Y032_0016g3117 [Ancylostoma ceylanicum]